MRLGGVTRPVLSVDLGAVRRNWRKLHALHGAEVAAVVKADGYGLGAARVAAALLAEGCRTFFVAHPQEGAALRRALGAGPAVAVLDGCSPAEAREHALTPVLNTLADLVAHRGQGMLHLDTGMARLGLPPAEWGGASATAVPWVMSHLVAAEEPDDETNALQRHRFSEGAALFPAARRSLANSSGCFLGEGFRSDLARPGAALWGLNPTPGRPNPMERVVRVEAPILQLRDIPAGASVGYGASWRAKRPSRVATVALGYADGLPRNFQKAGSARVAGVEAPVVGRVSMDLTTLDVTDVPGAVVGAMAELPEPDEIARRTGTIGYEILTRLGDRFERRYHGAA